MAIYTVQDSATQKKIKFEWFGDQPPTETDIAGIFASAQSAIPESTQKQLSGIPGGFKPMVKPSVLQKIDAVASKVGLGSEQWKAVGRMTGITPAADALELFTRYLAAGKNRNKVLSADEQARLDRYANQTEVVGQLAILALAGAEAIPAIKQNVGIIANRIAYKGEKIDPKVIFNIARKVDQGGKLSTYEQGVFDRIQALEPQVSRAEYIGGKKPLYDFVPRRPVAGLPAVQEIKPQVIPPQVITAQPKLSAPLERAALPVIQPKQLPAPKKGLFPELYAAQVAPEPIKTEPVVSEPIPKELEPLAVEARKYKTAEEFVKAQQDKGSVVYHGTSNKFEGGFKPPVKGEYGSEAVFFSPTESGAKYYVRNLEKGEIKKAIIGNDVKLWDFGNPKDIKVVEDFIDKNGVEKVDPSWILGKDAWIKDLKKGRYDVVQQPEVMEILRNNGYDGFMNIDHYDTGLGMSVGIFDPNKVKTVIQLIDIYTQATKPAGAVPPVVSQSAGAVLGKGKVPTVDELLSFYGNKVAPAVTPKVTPAVIPPQAVKVAPEPIKTEPVISTPQPAEIKPVAKEPWQIRKKDIGSNFETKQVGDDYIIKWSGSGKYGDEIGKEPVGFAGKENRLQAFHRRSVEEALSEGKPVPPEILKDYPDLAGKVEKPSSGYGFPQMAIPPYDKQAGIEPIELLELAKELSGKDPIVTRLHKYLGLFQPKTGQIKLSRDIFKNPKMTAQVMSHEIGHLTDWLPDYTMKRGNVLGRLLTMRKFLKGTFGDLSNKDIRTELKGVTQFLHPFDLNASPSHTAYRHKSSELYAEGLSLMLNDPAKVKELAPRFYSAFWGNIDKKPDVKKAFLDLYDFLTKGDEALLPKREGQVVDMFRKGEELYTEKRNAWKDNRASLRKRLTTELIDKNHSVIKKIEELKAKGVKINPEDNPQYLLEEYNYLAGKVQNVVDDVQAKVVDPILQAGLTIEDLGQYLFYTRIIGERSEIANPLGFDQITAQKQLDYLTKKIGLDKVPVMEAAVKNLRELSSAVVKRAEAGGLYKPETVAEILKNETYSTFQVLDYLQEYVTPSIIEQVGTLKEIANPIDATVLKMISTVKATERNITRNGVVKMLEKDFPKEVSEAESTRLGKYGVRFKEKMGTGLITLRRDGVSKGFYVDPYIADTVNYSPAIIGNGLITALRWANSSYFRPVYVGLNLGFQSYNLIRDMVRSWKLNPDLHFYEILPRYYRALSPAKQRVFGNITDQTVTEMREGGMLGFTYNDIYASDESPDEITHLFKLYNSIKKEPSRNPAKRTIEWLTDLGNVIESIPKIVGYQSRKEAMPNRSLKDISHEVRVYSGSPDFLRKGKGYDYTNNILLFSNAIKEGTRGDYEGAFRDPRTKSGYWAKTLIVNILPKVILFLAGMGYFGEKIKERLDKIPEYDKTNYIPIPIGEDKDGKAIYVRIPQDEVGRMMGGMFWKGLTFDKDNIARSISEVVVPFARQMPSLSPSVELLAGLYQLANGKSPISFFQGKPVISDDEMRAGGMYAVEPILKWAGNLAGLYGLTLGIENAKGEEPATAVWRFLPIISRFIKISDAGEKERYFQNRSNIYRRKAVQNIKRKEMYKRK